LNISYARDYVGINDPETSNQYRYGFSFDVRELREKFKNKMPSSEFSNVSIPMTYGDVVQQGRTKTYLRHSFNKNNKKGVLEQGIRMDGQLASKDQVNSFEYQTTSEQVPLNGSGLLAGFKPRRAEGEADLDSGIVRSIDPSIGITKTKTIHFVDSSIRRLGDYNYQSFYGEKQTGELEGDDKGMIVNIADEIYNISSRNISGVLYRQVLGEKLAAQQQQSFNLIKEMMNTVSEFASSTQLLLDAFLDHTHALPKIDLNLEKTIEVKDTYRTRPILQQQPDITVQLPGRVVAVPGSGGNAKRIYVPGGKTSIPQPPKVVSTGRLRTRNRKQQINFETIIGGAENPRFTAPVQTDKETTAQASPMPGSPPKNMEKTELGIKTGQVDNSLEEVISKFTSQRERLSKLTLKVNQFLSKNQFVN
jgi:hypothetical protein